MPLQKLRSSKKLESNKNVSRIKYQISIASRRKKVMVIPQGKTKWSTPNLRHSNILRKVFRI